MSTPRSPARNKSYAASAGSLASASAHAPPTSDTAPARQTTGTAHAAGGVRSIPKGSAWAKPPSLNNTATQTATAARAGPRTVPLAGKRQQQQPTPAAAKGGTGDKHGSRSAGGGVGGSSDTSASRAPNGSHKPLPAVKLQGVWAAGTPKLKQAQTQTQAQTHTQGSGGQGPQAGAPAPGLARKPVPAVPTPAPAPTRSPWGTPTRPRPHSSSSQTQASKPSSEQSTQASAGGRSSTGTQTPTRTDSPVAHKTAVPVAAAVTPAAEVDQKSVSSEPVGSSSPAGDGENMLESPWTFYMDKKQPKQTEFKRFEQNLRKLGTFKSAEGMWRHFAFIQQANQVPNDHNLYMFRHNFLPAWETFPDGGCWIIKVRKHNGLINRMWEELVFACCGELFEEPSIAGIVLSSRMQHDILQVWNKDNSSGDTRFRIGDKLQSVLNLDATTVTEYKFFTSAVQDGSTFRNAKQYVYRSPRVKPMPAPHPQQS